MKTFTLNKPYEELSFNEIILILIVIADEIDITKFNSNNEFGYHINSFRGAKDYTDENEFNINYLSLTWDILSEGKNLDSLKNQNSKTRNQLDSYLEFAINLGLIEIKFIEC